MKNQTIYVNPHDFKKLCNRLCKEIKEEQDLSKHKRIYGIPRGGCLVAQFVADKMGLEVTEQPSPKDTIIVDDLIDSGKTIKPFQKEGYPCYVLYDKRESKNKMWIEFFYEKTKQDEEDLIIRQLEMIGEDPNREGLKKTPKRVINSFKFLTQGYNQDVSPLFTKFTEKYDELVIVKDIEVYSLCEHHMIPFYGKCHIGYIPNGKVVGLSKLARLVDVFSRRLQVQERLTKQIADSINKNLQPKGVAVVMECCHMCMMMRGVQKQNCSTITSSMLGIMRHKPEARQEFLNLIK